jgi:hypothetical protein
VAKFCAVGTDGEFLEGSRHAGQAELAQLVEGGVGQQGAPPQW